MGRPKKKVTNEKVEDQSSDIQSELIEKEDIEGVVIAPQEEPKVKHIKVPSLLTSIQAWKTIGGNSRLNGFVAKKYKEHKTLEEWKIVFKKEGLI